MGRWVSGGRAGELPRLVSSYMQPVMVEVSRRRGHGGSGGRSRAPPSGVLKASRGCAAACPAVDGCFGRHKCSVGRWGSGDGGWMRSRVSGRVAAAVSRMATKPWARREKEHMHCRDNYRNYISKEQNIALARVLGEQKAKRGGIQRTETRQTRQSASDGTSYLLSVKIILLKVEREKVIRITR